MIHPSVKLFWTMFGIKMTCCCWLIISGSHWLTTTRRGCSPQSGPGRLLPRPHRRIPSWCGFLHPAANKLVNITWITISSWQDWYPPRPAGAFVNKKQQNWLIDRLVGFPMIWSSSPGCGIRPDSNLDQSGMSFSEISKAPVEISWKDQNNFVIK